MSDSIVTRGSGEIERDKWRESYAQWVGGEFGTVFRLELARLCVEMKAEMVKASDSGRGSRHREGPWDGRRDLRVTTQGDWR